MAKSPFMTPYSQNLTRPGMGKPVAQPAPMSPAPQTGGGDPMPASMVSQIGTMPQPPQMGGAPGQMSGMPPMPSMQQIMQILKGRQGGSGLMRTAGDAGGFSSPGGVDGVGAYGNGGSSAFGGFGPGYGGYGPETPGYGGGLGWGYNSQPAPGMPSGLNSSIPGMTIGTPSTPATPGPVGNVGRPGMGYGPSVGTGYGGNAGSGPAPGSDPNGYGGFANNGYGSMGYGVTPGGLAGYDSNGNAVAAGSAADTGGASSSKIVCTAMNEDYGFGSFRQAIWLRHSAGMTRAHERGYHAIFRPLLAWARKRATAPQRIVMAALEDIARMRTFDIRREARAGFWRGLNRGRVYRAILEPICYIVGRLAR